MLSRLNSKISKHLFPIKKTLLSIGTKKRNFFYISQIFVNFLDISNKKKSEFMFVEYQSTTAQEIRFSIKLSHYVKLQKTKTISELTD